MKENWTAGGFLSETSWTTTAERQPVVGYQTLSKQSSCVRKQRHGHTSHTKVNKDLITLLINVLFCNVFPWLVYLSNCCKVLPIRRPLGNVNGCSGPEWHKHKQWWQQFSLLYGEIRARGSSFSSHCVRVIILWSLVGHFRACISLFKLLSWICTCVIRWQLLMFGAFVCWHS